MKLILSGLIDNKHSIVTRISKISPPPPLYRIPVCKKIVATYTIYLLLAYVSTKFLSPLSHRHRNWGIRGGGGPNILVGGARICFASPNNHN